MKKAELRRNPKNLNANGKRKKHKGKSAENCMPVICSPPQLMAAGPISSTEPKKAGRNLNANGRKRKKCEERSTGDSMPVICGLPQRMAAGPTSSPAIWSDAPPAVDPPPPLFGGEVDDQ
jgi:hypothetical protein